MPEPERRRQGMMVKSFGKVGVRLSVYMDQDLYEWADNNSYIHNISKSVLVNHAMRYGKDKTDELIKEGNFIAIQMGVEE